MREEEIRRYAEIMRDCGITRLCVTEKGATVELERLQPAAGHVLAGNAAAPGASGTAAANRMSAESGTGVSAETLSGEPAGDWAGGSASYISVASPMIGMFYAAPAENADPFVSVGDRVEEGQTLCIIEAMKLMNEIRAERAGVIEQVCVSNGQVVEYGTELFRIRA